MIRSILLGILTVLTACPLQGTRSSTLGGGGGGGQAEPSSNDPDARVTVPKIMGMTKDQANAALASAGFTHGVDMYPMQCDDPKPAPGTIECQDPAPGQSVKATAMIKISVLEAEHTRITEEDLASLKGLTVEQAKARAKKLGHTGSITMQETDEFVADCKAGTVCKARDGRGVGGGMELYQPMVLYTNKSLTTAPPPD